MACAVAALGAEGPVVIEEAQAINKSYTDFYEHLRAWGVPVEEMKSSGNLISQTHE
jgi:3-phosphoshikimate 1-carboxyvinyltransferase